MIKRKILKLRRVYNMDKGGIKKQLLLTKCSPQLLTDTFPMFYFKVVITCGVITR